MERYLGKLEVFFFKQFRELLENDFGLGRHSETLNKVAIMQCYTAVWVRNSGNQGGEKGDT